MTDQWIIWIKKLRALAQNGLAYTENAYDRERYQELQDVVAVMLNTLSNNNVPEIKFFLESQNSYATPKIDVRGVIFKNDRILMVKERSEGLWTLPGGWADECLTPSENIIKEIKEETGFVAHVLRLLAVYDRAKHGHKPEFPFHIYKLFFLCEIVSGEIRDSHEISDVAFFAESDLPQLSASRITPHQIGRMFEMYRTDAVQTDFD